MIASPSSRYAALRRSGCPPCRTPGKCLALSATHRRRGRGKGSEAARLMMGYAASTLGVRRFVAKILEHNAPSLKLFERLGFKEFARVPVFREVHMERILDEAGLAEAAGWLGAAQIGSYDVG